LVDFGSCSRHYDDKIKIQEDLEELFFLLCFLVTGYLPWKSKNGEDYLTRESRNKAKELRDYLK